MHERAGDTILPKAKIVSRSVFPKEQKASVAQVNEPLSEPLPTPPPLDEKDDVGVIVVEKHRSVPLLPPIESILPMTRRFSVAEKIRILDKYHELDNISATCRWVRNEFKRPTFARKSLSTMISREEVYRRASGTKAKRKTVRTRIGAFPRMDKELAR